VAPSRIRRSALLAALGALVLANLAIVPVRAVGFLFIVDTKGDGVDANPLDNACETASGSCSLRAAVMQANAIDPGTGSHEIRINGTEHFMTVANTAGDENAAAKGDYDILQNTRIVGTGPATTILHAGTELGEGLDRFFDIRGNNIDVEISGITLMYGDANGGTGGAIRATDSGSHLTLDDVTIYFAATSNAGVAIWSAADLEITDSTIGNSQGRNGTIYTQGADVTIRRTSIVENRTTFNGSALYLAVESVALVDRSTIAANESGTGGPIVVGSSNVDDSSLTLRNSTVSSNTANAANGAMIGSFDEGVVTIESSTIGSNTGFGLDLNGPSSVKNTILSGNSRGNCAQDPTSAGHNLDTGTTCGFDASGDISSGSAKLGPLQDNGGPTLTRALSVESDAIDAGAACPSVDQRGASRPKDGDGSGVATCDIGAYEAAAVPVVVTPAPTIVVTAAPTIAPTIAPTAAASLPPASATPTDMPGGSITPTTDPGASDPGASALPGSSPGSSGAPVPSGSADFLGSNLWLILAMILVVLVVLLFFVLRRRLPEQPPAG
jgi:hypothetical protein